MTPHLLTRAAITTFGLLGSMASVSSCVSKPLEEGHQTQVAGTSGATNATGGKGGSTSAAGNGDEAGASGLLTGCQGAEESPTASKACGCTADCDFGESCADETLGIPGGSCLHNCEKGSDCPSDHECVQLVPGDPTTGVCWKTCAGADDCRAGFVCGPFAVLNPPSTAANLPKGNFCQPWCQQHSDCPVTGQCNRFTGVCGSPEPAKSDIGEPCVSAAGCTQVCFTEAAAPGGYCSSWCSRSNPGCPEGSICAGKLDADAGDFGFCLKECTTSDECRDQYLCLSPGVCW